VNYFGNFDAKVSGALGPDPGSHVFSKTVHASHVPSDAVVVSDAQLLFGAEFKRAGVDLVLSNDGHEFVVHDYFKGEHRASLASPDGAHLTGDIVTALAGEVQYAQADGNAAAHQVIGHVTKLTGTATAIRNGVSIILNSGDNVEKGDVVASGSDSTLGLTFIDGTVFGLSSNARMVLNEMVYDPNGSNNSSLLSLVAGTITFVAGETAKHGDMKVDTPVATMGIRGTAVLVEIDFSVPGATPDAKFQVLVEPDGTTGSYILFDKTTLTPLAVVDKAGLQVNISNGIMSQTLAPLSPEIQKLITDVFTLKFSDSTNTKSIQNFTDTIIPNAFGPVKFAALTGAPPPVPVVVNLVVANTSGPDDNSGVNVHIPIPPSVVTSNGTVLERPNTTGSTALDTATGVIKFADVNAGDQPTSTAKFTSFTYTGAQGQTLSLNQLQQNDIAAVEANISIIQDPAHKNFGTADWTYSVADGAFDFLAAGETLTLTYTAYVDNNYAPLDQVGTATITITITGTNDAPVITSSQQNINFVAAGTDTKGGDLIPDTATKGTLTFKDADLTDTHTVGVKMTSALLDGQDLGKTAGPIVINELAAALTANIASGNDSTGSGTGTITWTLADLQVYLADLVPSGETLVLTYAVTVTDSQGATSVQDIVVTIGGDQPSAVVWIDTNPIPPGGALWNVASNWEGDRVPGVGDDVIIGGTNQVLPGTPVFPVTVNDAEKANSLTIDYFTNLGSSIPELDIESTGSLTIAGALNMGTSTDSGSPLTAEAIIKNYGYLSVGGIAEILKYSVLENFDTLVLDQGGEFADHSSITNAGTIELVSDTLSVEVGIANSGGTIQVDKTATLELSDGATVTNGKLNIASGGTVDVEAGTSGPGATLDGVTVTGTSGATPSTIEVGITGAATLLLDDGTTITNGNLTIAGGSTVDIEAGTNGPGATLDGVTVSGVGGDTPSTIEIGTAGAATLLLDDGTTITNGNLTIAAGSTLDIEAGTNGLSAALDGVTVSGGGDLTVGSGATLTVDAVTLDDVTLSGDVTNSGTLTIKDTVTLDGATIDGGTIDDTGALVGHGAISSVITDSGALTASGGTLTLSGDNTYSGITTVDSGATLALSGTGSIAASSDLVDNGTFDISATTLGASIKTLSGDGTVTLGAQTLTLSDASTTFGGAIDGSGGLTLTTGTETLTGDNLYSGVTTINGGTLALSGTGSIAASSDVVDDGTFDISATTLGASVETLSGDGTVTLGAETLTLSDASTKFGGAIDGSGGLTLTTGTETLTGDNLYSGVTTINGGTLALSGAGSISDSSDVVDNGTFDISATTGASIKTLSGDGAVTLGAQTLTLSDASTMFSGTISSTGGGLTVAGGTLTLATVTLDDVTLSGNFDNSGTMTINDTVDLNSASITGGTIDVVGELDSVGTSFITGATIINLGHIHTLGGVLTIDPTPFTNAGLFEVQGPVAFSDEVVTNSLTVGNKTTNGTIQVDPNSTLTLDSSAIDGGIVSNSGTIDVVAGSANSTASSINDSFSFVNSGTVNADGAELDLVHTTINNTGGTFKTTGKGIFDLVNTTINGGTLAGQIATAIGNNVSTLNGITLASGLVTAVVGVLELTGTINNSGEFDATTGALDLSNAIVIGGTLGGDGTIATISNFNEFNGVSVAAGTTVGVSDGNALDLVGTITDAGKIALNSSSDTTKLEITGHVSLTGGGNVTMDDSFHNFIVSDGSAATLTNSDTISGAGTIGDSHLTLVNDGTIDATGSHALIIDTGSNFFTSTGIVGSLQVTNNVGGVLEASSGSTLLIEDNVLNNGLIASGNPGGHAAAYVDITGSVSGSGSINIFNNSTLEIGGSVSSGQVVTFGTPGGQVATNGLLVLDDSHDFHGTIAGLTDNAVESQENQVDLRDLLYIPGLTHAHYHNGEVTISDFFDSVTLNVSGNSSGSFEVTSDGLGGTLLSDPAASGNVTVDSNQTLDISAASSATVTFTNTTANTGELVLDDSKDFTGTVAGFTGDGTTANSDLIDITDIQIADVAANKTTYTENAAGTGGTLTLYNASGQALDSIDFDGNYQLANFIIENDGEGGTMVVDPPVNASGQSSTNTHMASNHNPAGTAATDGFAFNFAGLNHAPTSDFHHWDTFPPNGPISAGTPSSANSAADPGHVGMPTGSDGHDQFGLTAFAKAHLHGSDFHLV
jgi:fibronectin-binding autotransporter adhesin